MTESSPSTPPDPASPPPGGRWLVLSLPRPPRGEEHLLLGALRSLGVHAVERKGARWFAHLGIPADAREAVRAVEGAYRSATSLRHPYIAWHWRSAQEWAEEWRRDFRPRRVSKRILVSAGVDAPDPNPGDAHVRLVPGVGFGTAEHATTRACLRFLDALVEPGDRIADLGTGSGILAVAAALLGAASVVALEKDAEACAAARRNVAENDVADRVEIHEVKATPAKLRALGRFQGVVANLESGALLPLLPALRRALLPEGWLVLSGLHRGERSALLDAAARSGLEPGGEDVEEGWWSVRLVPR